MRIVVSDSRCLIDLGKVALLDTFLRLPYEFLISNTLFEEEPLQFTAVQKKTLVCSPFISTFCRFYARSTLLIYKYRSSKPLSVFVSKIQ